VTHEHSGLLKRDGVKSAKRRDAVLSLRRALGLSANRMQFPNIEPVLSPSRWLRQVNFPDRLNQAHKFLTGCGTNGSSLHTSMPYESDRSDQQICNLQ
jgi:hypothetical protein